jgi:hypothetical protein
MTDEERIQEEDKLLHLYGLHQAYENDDGDEVWQLGSSGNPVKEPQFLTRAEALAYVEERRLGGHG